MNGSHAEPQQSVALVVDDHEAVLAVVSETLAVGGYSVVVARSGRRALASVDAGATPALLVTDIDMPGMSGFVLAEELRRRLPSVRVVFVSADPRHARACPPEWSRFLHKPFRGRDLLEAAAQVLAGQGDAVTRVHYVIDAGDVIRDVGGAWAAFARSNQAEHLAEGVLGHSLWRHINGAETREIYRTLLQTVREGRTVRFPFRCPSPTVDRDLTMTMRPLREGAVAFETELLAETPRRLSSRRDVPPLLHVCSWCKRVQRGDDWLDTEFAVEVFEVFTHRSMPRLTHGICPACFESVAEAM